MTEEGQQVTAVHRVVVVGGGFGGIRAVQKLRRLPVEITLIDKRNFHLFQPLTYQVATGALSPGEVAYPLRAMFAKNPNVRVMLARVNDVDLARHTVSLEHAPGVPAPASVPYDTLIVATGSSYSYFGHEPWRAFSAEVKSLESAVSVRTRLLRAFERAELDPDADARADELTFVIVGAGPTGVEMAGQIAELAIDTLRRDFRVIDPTCARILLLEAGDRVLPAFPPSLSARAKKALEQLGVTVRLRAPVMDMDAKSVTVTAADGGRETIAAGTIVWAAGVMASGLGAQLAERCGGEIDAAGRLTVERDLTLPGHPDVIVLGDMVRVRGRDGRPTTLPGVAPVAIQQGHYAAELVERRLAGRRPRPFRYRNKGNLATIGRRSAVADLRVVRVSGTLAWLVWLLVHLWYLIGFQNRLIVFIRWSVSFFTRGRGARIIDELSPVERPRAARDEIKETVGAGLEAE
jgi:NADH:quinone reductase (non-electrogenic)